MIFLQNILKRLILPIFDASITEVPINASIIGKYRKLHPVFKCSRLTTDAGYKMHSYELETLAVVEGSNKFKIYFFWETFNCLDRFQRFNSY